MKLLFAFPAFVVFFKSTVTSSGIHHKKESGVYGNNYEEYSVIDEEIPDEMTDGFIGPYGLFTSDVSFRSSINADDTPPPSISPAPSWILEAEDAYLSDGVVIAIYNIFPGFTGSSYTDYITNGAETYIEWEFSETGLFNLQFRYALERSSRPLKLSINGEEQAIIQFPNTGGWGNWGYTEPFKVFLNPGTNIIRMAAYCCSGGNVDHLFIEELVLSETDLLATIAKFEGHVDGTSPLSKAKMFDELQVFFYNSKLLEHNCDCLGAALELIETYEDIYGALFINSKTQGGIYRDWATNDNLELERSMLYIQQTLIDVVYHEQLPYGNEVELPLRNCDEQLTGYK